MTPFHDRPWMIQCHYLTMRQWSPEFCPSDATINKTLTWIHIMELLLVLYGNDILQAIRICIGKLFKIDNNMSQLLEGNLLKFVWKSIE